MNAIWVHVRPTGKRFLIHMQQTGFSALFCQGACFWRMPVPGQQCPPVLEHQRTFVGRGIANGQKISDDQ